jgi:hypothetical protein
MAHVVETGSGLSNANAYLSAAEADLYWADHGAPDDWTAALTAEKEEAIRAATEALDALYGQRWRGSRVQSAQALDWPRTSVEDDDGFTVESTSLPLRLKSSCAILSFEALTGGGETSSLVPDITDTGALSALTETLGPLSRTQQWVGGRSQVKWRPLVDGLLRPLILAGGTVIRA